jgi:hypothetical protein
MPRKRRVHCTETDKAVMWDRWEWAILWRILLNFWPIS